ncbi:Golgi CORVET complex core vacuolar protein 8-domain-containing protein [Cyathus striatus]|nr:Golgi CORVET complex core vacuolar protein 8-domain-containing protein [Cyathus striatus]
MGTPTVLTANGLICIGMDSGKVCVYDFKQTLKCVCGGDSSDTLGPVTALALSYDHTCIACGHSSGHVQVFELKTPHVALRSVPPTTLTAVLSGRKEGHLRGSRIVSIGFVAGRHTSIVTADEHGLAFFHRLGKVLFVEAPDILRILGKYPDNPATTSPTMKSGAVTKSGTMPVLDPLVRRRRSRYTILSMSPLPLGTSAHVTDEYNLIALLTPTKLVVVGLKPTPKTWFKCPREADEGGHWKTKTKWNGVLAWFPSVMLSPKSRTETIQPVESKASENAGIATTPILAFSWGNAVRLIRVVENRVKQNVGNSKTGRVIQVDVATIVHEPITKFTVKDEIVGLQWLNANQIVILTASMLGIFDIHLALFIEQLPFDGLSLMSPTLLYTALGIIPYGDSVSDVAHSLRVYKGKIFMLKRDRLQVGTLLTWADRILAFVQEGDFISAIDLTRKYYLNEAPGNRNGLPDDPQHRKNVIGEKMRHLMLASARYAFSEDRMTDETHITPNNRGVDRTSLFEDLVSVCCRACVSLGDFDFLFEDLFQYYDDYAITTIYLRRLEPFVLSNDIRYIPPRITQRLVALHENDGRPDKIERIIWHIDPICLDINQAIQICQRHHLYDALIYVYTRALRDYVSPLVQLLELIRKVQQYRKSSPNFSSDHSGSTTVDSIESLIVSSYKIYPYLAFVFSGLTYPSEEPLPEDEAFQAKKELYSFLFFGRSSMWPPGEGGKLILTSDEGGVEPTYPYARQLLQYDAEAFLHSLDIAFEDSYLNDESQSITRLVVIRILLEIISDEGFTCEDITLVNIFFARNVPKYPQFLEPLLSPTILHGVLIGLAHDPDQETREDRQLAAEYLLSVYNPHESDKIVGLFENAGFYRILRTWYQEDHRWAPLLSVYLKDPEYASADLLTKIDDILCASARSNKGHIPDELIAIFSNSLSQLLDSSIPGTMAVIDKHFPKLHLQALDAFGNTDESRFSYLGRLLDPPQVNGNEDVLRYRSAVTPPPELYYSYLGLKCQYDPENAIDTLRRYPKDLEWSRLTDICESKHAYSAVVWAKNMSGQPEEALSKADSYQKTLTSQLIKSLKDSRFTDGCEELRYLNSISSVAVDICLEHSRELATDVPLEDIWFKLLSSQIACVQMVSSICLDESAASSSLRSIVQTTFAALVSITSTHAVSFPRLFKRLVNSATTINGTHYTEFRTILTGMLESYRSDGDMLTITKHLVERDLYDVIAILCQERGRGWTATRGICIHCRKPLLNKHKDTSSLSNISYQVVISRTGGYHTGCI